MSMSGALAQAGAGAAAQVQDPGGGGERRHVRDLRGAAVAQEAAALDDVRHLGGDHALPSGVTVLDLAEGVAREDVEVVLVDVLELLDEAVVGQVAVELAQG